MSKTKWREQVDKDPSFCRKSCCWTPYACGRAYECRCHTILDVSK